MRLKKASVSSILKVITQKGKAMRIALLRLSCQTRKTTSIRLASRSSVRVSVIAAWPFSLLAPGMMTLHSDRAKLSRMRIGQMCSITKSGGSTTSFPQRCSQNSLGTCRTTYERFIHSLRAKSVQISNILRPRRFMAQVERHVTLKPMTNF